MYFANCIGGSRILNNGSEIPMIGLGIARIEGQECIDVAVHSALSVGYRLFDTAELYGNEKELGVALSKYLPVFGLKRKDIFITTKVQTKDGDVAEWVETSIQKSLENLSTTYLDMVLVHFPRDRYTGEDEAYEKNKYGRRVVWQKLEEIKERGIIRSIGVSNYEVYHLVELLEYAKELPSMNQVEYHPYFTRPTLRKYCESNGIFVQAFSSLCWGNQDILNEPVVQNLAKKYGVSVQTILYAFAIRSGVGIVPKSDTPTHINDNLLKVSTTLLSEMEIHSLSLLDQNRAFCPRCFPWRCL